MILIYFYFIYLLSYYFLLSSLFFLSSRRSVSDTDLAQYMRFASQLGQQRAAMGLNEFKMNPGGSSAVTMPSASPAAAAAPSVEDDLYA